MKFFIRPVRIEDAEQLNALRRQPETARTMLAIPSERVDRSENFIKNLDMYSHEFVAVTVLPGGSEKLIGIAGINVKKSPRMNHCADLGICVDKNCWGQGIGSALMEQLLDLADNWLRLVRVELTVDFDNERAISLYEKYGFEREGVQRKACVRDGEYIDLIMMSRIRHAD
ncbi:MAG: GNAT family N-acetyltransferase [Oscillospiraceae bacterium]